MPVGFKFRFTIIYIFLGAWHLEYLTFSKMINKNFNAQGPRPFQTMTCLQKRRDHSGVPQITAAEKCQPQSVAHGEGFAEEIANSLGAMGKGDFSLKMCMVLDESMFDDYDACPNIYEGKRE